MSPQLRIRVDLAPGCSIGPGKVSLLEAIEREGSLSVAARSIGMSYRRAWNLLADLNRSFAKPVVDDRGGRHAAAVVPVSRISAVRSIAAFRALERGALPLAATRMRRFTASRAIAGAAGAPHAASAAGCAQR